MITIEQIKITDVEQLAEKILRELPEFEVDSDDYNEDGYLYKDETFEITIEEEFMVMNFDITVEMRGTCIQTQKQTYFQPAEYREKRYDEITDIVLFVDGVEVEILNLWDLMKILNKRLNFK
jgi:hypothetical protein